MSYNDKRKKLFCSTAGSASRTVIKLLKGQALAFGKFFAIAEIFQNRTEGYVRGSFGSLELLS